jgi:hypothetical protein
VVVERPHETVVQDAPPIDPDAVRREYRRQRALRKAKIDRERRTKRAGARFWLVLALLVAGAVFVALTTWRQIGELFGL